ncbi:unnamed protein product [Protopolystoma xenopodis]|uniref:Uncharacterized protein n=1 Tax=Protopolystoma xenopodis TaxID=117903 RepID=A0A3S5FEC8_9PLAT|nr:unnamed protein product [Protopolystoma xenopodis]
MVSRPNTLSRPSVGLTSLETGRFLTGRCRLLTDNSVQRSGCLQITTARADVYDRQSRPIACGIESN